jgi:hypothetical protein
MQGAFFRSLISPGILSARSVIGAPSFLPEWKGVVIFIRAEGV